MGNNYDPDIILHTVKKAIPLDIDYTPFDDELIMHTNSVLARTSLLGIDNYITITGYTEKWSDYISDMEELENVKSYVGLKVKKIFDPPSSSSVMKALDESISELEFMIHITTNPKENNNG